MVAEYSMSFRQRYPLSILGGQTLVWNPDPWYDLVVGTDIQAPGPQWWGKSRRVRAGF